MSENKMTGEPRPYLRGGDDIVGAGFMPDRKEIRRNNRSI